MTCSQVGVLQDTRSADGKMTLLKYIAEDVCSHAPSHQLLAEEVPHVPRLTTSLAVRLPNALFCTKILQSLEWKVDLCF